MAKFLIPIVIFILIVTVASVAFLTSVYEHDNATSATSKANLLLVALPTDLPRLVDEKGAGDSSQPYHDAIKLYIKRADFFKDNPPPKADIETLIQKIMQGGSMGAPRADWAHEYIVLAPGGKPTWANAPSEITHIILKREILSKIGDGKFNGDKADARQVLDAVFLFGKRLYDNNRRYMIKRQGLLVMNEALRLYNLALGEKQIATEWQKASTKVDQAWKRKIKIIHKYKANVSDLARFAERDGDECMRVEAILQLGRARWIQPSPGNKGVIAEALDGLMKDKNRLIADAAKAAKELKRADVHKNP